MAEARRSRASEGGKAAERTGFGETGVPDPVQDGPPRPEVLPELPEGLQREGEARGQAGGDAAVSLQGEPAAQGFAREAFGHAGVPVNHVLSVGPREQRRGAPLPFRRGCAKRKERQDAVPFEGPQSPDVHLRS